MIRQILLFFFLHLAGFGFAQQASQYSMYMLNPAQFNPAYAGMEETLNFTGVFRRQWLNLEGSPSQQVLNAHMPLYFLNSGIGVGFENDVLGARQYSKFSLQGNYQMPIGSGVLSLGANAGMVQLNWDGAALRTPEGTYTDVMFNHNDNLPLIGVNAGTFTFGAGAYYKSEKFEIGISANNLTEPSVDIANVQLNLKRHVFLNSGYKFDLTRLIEVKPSIMIKYDFVNIQTDMSFIFGYSENILFGAGVRGYNSNSLDAATIMGGWHLSQQLLLAYSYDISISSLANVNDGSHEIMLKYRLANKIGKGKLPKVIYNPRFL